MLKRCAILKFDRAAHTSSGVCKDKVYTFQMFSVFDLNLPR